MREDLTNLGWMGHPFLWWLIASSILVAIGVVFEGPEIIHEISPVIRRWLKKPKKRSSRCVEDFVKIVGLVGWIIVIAGVIGEGIFEGLDNRAQGLLQTFDDTILASAQRDSTDAIERSTDNEIVGDQLRNDTQGLVTEAATAKRDMIQAQLELARLNGPPHRITVRSGVAIPDLTKSNKQVVVLTMDTRIALPKLPRGKHLDWTLSLIQDGVGGHHFTFSPDIGGFDPNALSTPHTGWLVGLQTDENGTRYTSLGGILIPAPSTIAPTRK